ncbi:MAG: nucleoside-diphosphate kinase [Verrucomicrobiota bacterium]|nr:nucleoside-diphosphate kinase [Verrucomicrobiota bacterium]
MASTRTQSIEQTLTIIKPDAVAQNMIGNIIEYFEREGLSLVAAKMTHLKESDAERFYAIHKERAFFRELVEFMTSGPVLILVFQGDNAVVRVREIMGATDPAKAAPGTIRADFATSIDRNAIHGSDSLKTAKSEIEFFFTPQEIFSRTQG